MTFLALFEDFRTVISTMRALIWLQLFTEKSISYQFLYRIILVSLWQARLESACYGLLWNAFYFSKGQMTGTKQRQGTQDPTIFKYLRQLFWSVPGFRKPLISSNHRGSWQSRYLKIMLTCLHVSLKLCSREVFVYSYPDSRFVATSLTGKIFRHSQHLRWSFCYEFFRKLLYRALSIMANLFVLKIKQCLKGKE